MILQKQVKTVLLSIKHKDGTAPIEFLEANGLVHSLQYPIGHVCEEDNGHVCIDLATSIVGGVITRSHIDA
jgi:hypothetical protein